MPRAAITMGGPLWTASEEDYFWTKVVPFSDKKIGHDKKTQRGEVSSWDTSAHCRVATRYAAQNKRYMYISSQAGNNNLELPVAGQR